MTTYGYDRVGNLDWTDLPGNMAVDYVYDNMNRLTDEIYFLDNDADRIFEWNDINFDGIYQPNEGEAPLARFRPTRDIEGRRVHSIDQTFSAGFTNTELYDWTYDEIGRLRSERYQKVAFENTGYIDWFAYDQNSNRTDIRRDKLGTNSPFPPSTTTRTYDANDRLRTEFIDRSMDNLSQNERITYTYGPNNSGTQLTEQLNAVAGLFYRTNIEYDSAGRQLRRTANRFTGSPSGTPDSTTISETRYSIDGHRVYKHVTDVGEYRYFVDPFSPTGYAEILEERAPNALPIHYSLGHTVLGQASVSNAASLFITDPLGSVRQIRLASDTTQGLGSAQSYDAFGNEHSANLASSISLGYAGQYTDRFGAQNNMTTQIYSRARYYAPATGTFTTLDPFAGNTGEPLSLHKYLYAHADPVNGKDPSGRERIVSPEEGDVIHIIIQAYYAAEHPNDDILLGEPTGLGTPGSEISRAKPDILNFTNSTFNEIKPNTSNGRATGRSQVRKYNRLLNPNDIAADPSWPDVPRALVYGSNVIAYWKDATDGLILYDRRTLDRRPRIPPLVWERVRVLVNEEALALSTAAILASIVLTYPKWSSLVLQPTITYTSQSISGLASAARSIDAARLDSGLSSAMTLAIMTGF